MRARISNESLLVEVDEASGRLTATHQPSQRRFLEIPLAAVDGPVTLRSERAYGVVGGECERLTAVTPRGDEVAIYAPPGLPFLCIQLSVYNPEEEGVEHRSLRPVRGLVDLGVPLERVRAFGTFGLEPPGDHSGSYAFLALVDPESRSGVVSGWLTHDRGSGVFIAVVEEERALLECQIDYGRLRVPPKARAELETLVIGYFDDARLGLEAYADAVAEVYSVKLPPKPSGYCTWYSDLYGGAGDEEHMKKLAAFAAKHLKPFGFEFLQIDDKWQLGARRNGPGKNFTGHDPKGPYPNGMKAIADEIKGLGLRPGIWFMPFAGDHEDPVFKDEWFVRRPTGEPYETQWGGTCLDMTHPGARDHLMGILQRLTKEWGYTYLKMDGLWTGTGTEQVYVNEGYRDDAIGDAVFHNPEKTNIEAFRDGLRLVREVVGDDVFLLGCCAPQNLRSLGGAFGLVDAMRIGPDNGTSWTALVRGPRFGSRYYFLHGRVWYNDPDPVYVRSRMPLNHAQLIASWVAVSGQLTASSDWLPALPQNRLDILKRIMPSHGLRPRPVDLFERDIPRLWLLTSEGSPRRHIVAVFNWDAKRLDLSYPLDRIGLAKEQEYVAFDYWNNALVGPFRGLLELSVPKESCRILSVRPASVRPQVISTSRHVTQGIIDLIEERWDEEKSALKGRSRVVGGDPYELRVVAPSSGAWRVKGVALSVPGAGSAPAASHKSDGALWRVTIDSETSCEVEWEVQFERGA